MFCSSYTSYLYTPEFLGYALHATSAISLPFHVLAFYCVIYKTPKRVESIKTCMLVVCVWNLVLDMIMTLLVAPFVLIPSVAIWGLGLLSDAGVSMSIQSFLMMFILAGCGTSLCCLIANRYNNIKPTGFKHHQYLIYSINLIITLICDYFCAFYDIPDQNVALPNLFEKLSCIPQHYRSHSIFIITQNLPVVMFSIGGMTSLVIVEGIFLFFLIMHHLKKQTTISRRTQQMQKSFIFSLSLQIVIPIFLIAVPLFYMVYSSLSDHYNQASNNLLILDAALHGTVSSISMIVIHKPYRQVIWWSKKNNVSQIIIHSSIANQAVSSRIK